MSKVSKITLFMLVDLTNEFLKYVLYLQTFLPGLLPHCNLTYMTSEKNYLTSSISFDMSYLKITFQTQFSGTSNTLIKLDKVYVEKKEDTIKQLISSSVQSMSSENADCPL